MTSADSPSCREGSHFSRRASALATSLLISKYPVPIEPRRTNDSLREQIVRVSPKSVVQRMKSILTSFRSHRPRSPRSEENKSGRDFDQRLLRNLLESEIELGLIFACTARAAYKAADFGRGENAHVKVEQSYARVARLAAEIDSTSRSSLETRLDELRVELGVLRVLRDESAAQS